VRQAVPYVGRMRARWRAVLATAAAFAVACAAVVLAPVPALAANASDFNAGYLVSDATFYDADAMDSGAVQRFLEARVPVCRTTGPPCLKDYSTSTPTRAAEAGRCDRYEGRSSETAAQIIVRVGRACGINPRALLVLIEKEQSLVSDATPSSRQYRSATGYGCPDTADCDANFYGFFNQVYTAALQFKRYAAAPDGRAYVAGRNNQILYHPNSACGTKTVYIRNQATAGLYLYTPYTPNQAALANLYGAGDSCSSYGNRNFWRIFTDWFGSPTGGDSPTGDLTRVRGGYQAARVTGWATDANTTDPIRVHIYVDGVGKASVLADEPESSGRDRGFDVVVDGLTPGSHRVCAYGIDVGPGSNRLLGCELVTVPSGSPFGVIDSAWSAPGEIGLRGWAIDPDTTDPIRVHVYVDGVGRASIAADGVKEGLDRAKPGFGDEHAYERVITGVGPGTHRVCAYAINVEGGGNRSIGCRTVAMPSGSPVGALDIAASPDIGEIEVGGWAYDPDTTDPIRVHVYVDGRGAASIAADEPNPSTASVPPGYGDAHGFSRVVSGFSPGSHRVCAYGIDVGAGSNVLLGCATVEMPSGSPIGLIDEAWAPGGGGELSIRGWAFDPDTIDPIRVHVYVDGIGKASVEAGLEKTGLSNSFPGIGDFHGYRAELTGIEPGERRICAYGIDLVDPGSTRSLGCRTVTVP